MAGTNDNLSPNSIWLATDSEWDKTQFDPWVSTQFSFPDGQQVIFIRADLPDEVKRRLVDTETKAGVQLVFRSRDDGSMLLLDALRLAGFDDVKEVRLLTFFSPKDLEYAVGWNALKIAIDKNKVRQRHNLSGTVELPNLKVYIKDISGWAGKTSLNKFASALGITMESKSVMDEYKSHMMDGLVGHPEDFLRYSLDDARVLLDCQTSFLTLFNEVQRDCLGLDEDWEADSVPMTLGSLVVSTFQQWLYRRGHKDVVNYAIRRLGILDQDDHRFKRNQWAFWRTLRKYRSSELVIQAIDEDQGDIKVFLHAKFDSTGMDACSVKTWADRPTTTTLPFNALVHGGRCNNELPFDYCLNDGADIDISGCYGESLRTLTYPLGIPSAWAFSSNEERMTFGDWLVQHESDLIPGLWTATISGALDFEQDLLHSKLVSAKDIRRVSKHADDKSDILCDFPLLRREVKNAIITHDLLEAIRKIASNREWKRILSLQLVTATAYRKSDRVESFEEWCCTVIRDPGEFRVKSGTPVDSRNRSWVGIPLDDFVGKLADLRKKYKRSKKDQSLPEQDQKRYEGLDHVLKLMINVLYGTMASSFFPIGNTVVANNITGRARLGVWMLAKSLGLRQTITDGGIYSPRSVYYFEGKRPGLDTLSRPWKWHAPHRQRWNRPMKGWEEEIPLPELDQLALNHVQTFWSPYEIDFPFGIEHKTTMKRAAYWARGDYALLMADGSITYALRGKDKSKRSDSKPHPTFGLLKNILDDSNQFPDDLKYTKGSILKIGKYRAVQASNGYSDLKNLRPGDDYSAEFVARYNNQFFPIANEKDFLSRKQRKRTVKGRDVEWFERHRGKGIGAVHRAMSRNQLR
jgi:hypothetical protein